MPIQLTEKRTNLHVYFTFVLKLLQLQSRVGLVELLHIRLVNLSQACV